GARGDVEHAQGFVRDAGDEEPPPARVLAEREQAGVTVVRRAERREQLAGVPRPRRELGHSPSVSRAATGVVVVRAPKVASMALTDDVERIAAAAARFAASGERV